MYIILSQKKESSDYADELFKVYNFPQKYRRNIHEGDRFVYHQGGRNGSAPCYYGMGLIGKITPAAQAGRYDAELLNGIPFEFDLPTKLPDGVTYIEQLGKSNLPAWEWAIRKLTDEAYHYIESHAGIKPVVIDENPDEEKKYNNHGAVDSKGRIVQIRPRDKKIADAVKEIAAGVCQLCGKPAPFMDGNGKPYLECHHVVWLADGGADSVYNAVALCPNCHRRMHVLKLTEDIELLKEKAANN